METSGAYFISTGWTKLASKTIFWKYNFHRLLLVIISAYICIYLCQNWLLILRLQNQIKVDFPSKVWEEHLPQLSYRNLVFHRPKQAQVAFRSHHSLQVDISPKYLVVILFTYPSNFARNCSCFRKSSKNFRRNYASNGGTRQTSKTILGKGGPCFTWSSHSITKGRTELASETIFRK